MKWLALLLVLNAYPTFSLAHEINIECRAVRNVFEVFDGGGGTSKEHEAQNLTVKYISQIESEASTELMDRTIALKTGCFAFGYDSQKDKYIVRPGLAIWMGQPNDPSNKSISGWFPIQAQFGYIHQEEGVNAFGSEAGIAKLWGVQCKWVGDAPGDCEP